MTRSAGRDVPAGLRESAGPAAILALALAVVIEMLVSQQSSAFEAPATVPRTLVVLALLAAPGVIGLLGAWANRAEIVVAAGVICVAQSAVSFGGVTLVFLLPGLLLLRAAAGACPDQPVRPRRVAVAVIVAIPIALLTLRFLGIFAVLLLVAIAGVAPGLRGPRREHARVDRAQAVVGVVIVALVAAAWVAALGLTETVCWTARADANGSVHIERASETDVASLTSGEADGGCASGMPTIAGTGMTASFLAAALVLSAVPWPPPRHRAEEESG
jgi:hypothetical protein